MANTMDLITLNQWVYPTTGPGVPVYKPDDGVGRHTNVAYNTPSPYQNVYKPQEVVEKFDSLIWKEGFRTSGSFELKTYDIEATMKKLSKGTLVSLRDADEVCIVTTLLINSDEAGQDVLTITGTSLLAFLMENRPTWSFQENPANPSVVNADRVNMVFRIPDHLAFIIWAGVVFPHAEGGFPTSNKPFELPLNICVPHTMVTLSIAQRGDYYRAEWPPPIQTRLTSVSEILDLDQRFGVRTIRPKNTESALVYRPKLDSLRGEGATTIENNISKLRFDVYQGRDLTGGNDRIMFRHDSGDINSSEFLTSIQGTKNVVASHFEVDYEQFKGIEPPTFSYNVWPGDAKTDFAGNPVYQDVDARKYVTGIGFAMGEVESSVKLPTTDTDLSAVAVSRLLSDGEKFLRQNKEIELLTANISTNTQYKYKDDYDLGDIVFVQGKYGVAQRMLVSEYTRTYDANGVSGFPTLVRWEDPDA